MRAGKKISFDENRKEEKRREDTSFIQLCMMRTVRQTGNGPRSMHSGIRQVLFVQSADWTNDLRSLSVCGCLCGSASVCVGDCVCLPVCVCVWVSVSVSMSVVHESGLCLCLCLCPYVSICFTCIYVYVYVSVCIYVYLDLSLSLQRRRVCQQNAHMLKACGRCAGTHGRFESTYGFFSVHCTHHDHNHSQKEHATHTLHPHIAHQIGDER